MTNLLSWVLAKCFMTVNLLVLGFAYLWTLIVFDMKVIHNIKYKITIKLYSNISFYYFHKFQFNRYRILKSVGMRTKIIRPKTRLIAIKFRLPLKILVIYLLCHNSVITLSY